MSELKNSIIVGMQEQISRQKAETAELYFWLNHAHAWLDIDADYKDSPICEKITETLAKYKAVK